MKTQSSEMNQQTLPLQNICQIIKDNKGASLATLHDKNTPQSTYAPYVIDKNKIYLYLSKLADHTINLLDSPVVSLLILESEQAVSNPFARKRLSLNCKAAIIERNTECWGAITDKMSNELGGTMSVLVTLPDFILFELSVVEGNFVQGFGAAFQLSKEDWKNISERL